MLFTWSHVVIWLLMYFFSCCQQVPLLMFSWLWFSSLLFIPFKCLPLFSLIIIQNVDIQGAHVKRKALFSISPAPAQLQAVPLLNLCLPTLNQTLSQVFCLWAINLCLSPFPVFIWSVHDWPWDDWVFGLLPLQNRGEVNACKGI